jgi:type I restriction enzyme S subunit
MSEWKKVKLGELCDFINGGAWSDKEYASEGIPVLKVTNCKNSGFALDDLSYLPYSLKQKYSQNELKLHDVIIATVGSHPNLVNSSAGRSVIVNSLVTGFYLNQNAVCIRTKDANILDQRYFGYYSKYYLFQNYIQMRGKGAANQMRIAIGSIKEYPMPLPPVALQAKIGGILSNYDSLIENYQKQIKLLEEAAQRLYKEWFVDLHFPGHETTKIVDGVPEGWEKKKLSDIANIVMGQSPKSEFYNLEGNGLPFHQGVGSYGFRFVVDNVYSTSFTRIAEPNSILFSVRAPVGRLNITKNKIVIGRGLAAMNHKKGCQSYLYYLLKEKFFRDNIIGNGAIFASISKEELYNQVFVVPNDKIVMGFDAIAGKIDKEIQSIDTQIRLLTEARDRLLPKLMSGEISVDSICNIHAQSVGSELEVRNGRTGSPQATDS